MKFLQALLAASLTLQSVALSIGGKKFVVKKDSDALQDIVSHHQLLRLEFIFIKITGWYINENQGKI